MKKNLNIMKPHYSEDILPVSWPFCKFRFHCTQTECPSTLYSGPNVNPPHSNQGTVLVAESKFETFYVGTRVGTGCPVSSLFLIVPKHFIFYGVTKHFFAIFLPQLEVNP